MFSGRKCKICSTKYSKDDNSVVRLDTKEGVLEIDICPTCADLMDKCADNLLRKKNRNESV